MDSILLAVTPYKEIIIGALIASLGFIYKSSRQKKRQLKQAFYYLFEIWHYLSAIHKFQPEKFARDVVEEIISEFRLKATEKEIAQSCQMISLILFNHVKPTLIKLSNNSISKLSKPFESAIKEIALDYPFIAYRINTNIELDELTNSLNSLVSIIDDIDEKEKIHASNVLQSKIYTDSASTLLTNLKSLAFRISLLTYFKSHYYIYKRNKRLKMTKASIKSEILPAIKEMLPKGS